MDPGAEDMQPPENTEDTIVYWYSTTYQLQIPIENEQESSVDRSYFILVLLMVSDRTQSESSGLYHKLH